jgi:ABC-type phosphate/phosphonate transport system substrate-binding protein
MLFQWLSFPILALLALASLPVYATDGTGGTQTKTSLNMASASPASGSTRSSAVLSPGPIILSAPPRDSIEEGRRIFGPIADYLSSVLNRRVVYHHPTTWGGYQADMQAGAYDLVFDGPHFNSWRIDHQKHNVLLRIPGEFVYTAVVRAEHAAINDLKQLAGHKICAHAPPNLGTLIMYNQFDNPSRQPVVMVEEGYEQIYQALLKGKCEAAMLPLGHLLKFEKDRPQTRIVFRSTTMPQQAFSAGPRLAPAEQARISDALRSPAAAMALIDFRKTYGIKGNFIPASNAEYAGLDKYLKDTWGYSH